MESTQSILVATKKASTSLAMCDNNTKNKALFEMAAALIKNADAIIEANKIDVENAKGVISDVMIDRLMLDEKRINAMADGIRDVANLPDPCGKIIKEFTREDGLNVKKVSVPFGVVGIIFESRPNVTSDAAALCIKSGNACVLRCGKEASHSANAIVDALKNGLEKTGINPDCIGLIKDTSRESANQMMRANGLIDMLVPRGGKGLIDACVKNATVPCIQTGTGICHIYIDKDADIEKALKIVKNAKMSRPSVCNAAEVCLVNRQVANEFLPKLKDVLEGAEIRGTKEVCDIIDCTLAGDCDFDTEFLDYILAVKIVEDVNEAVSHILTHSTGHSEAIVTENQNTANVFCTMTDSAAVYVNASTRFTDGGEFGLGCEMGISTQKLHARGPMGLEELNTYKYIITGDGHVR